MNGKIISVIVVLMLAGVACGFNVNLPGQNKAGPEIKDTITVADPKLALSGVEASDETRLSLSFGAGKLKLSPGAKNLVDGTALYNVKDLKPQVSKNGGQIEIRQGNFAGLPPFEGMENEWDLQLGKSPMDLVIEAGAYNSEMELGGLSLKSLAIKDGASDVTLSFSVPNLVAMSEFSYTTGASDVTLNGLANANFKTFVFNSGAGNYNIDFSGALQRDATASIDSGLSDLTVLIPGKMNAIVTIDSALANVTVPKGWSQSAKIYTQPGKGPTLTVIINMGAGDISIRSE